MGAKINVGIVGARFAADFHCDAFSRNEKVVVAALTAPSGPEDLARKWGVAETYHDYREMLRRPDIDVISVCTPNAHHYEVVMAAAASGKHVIVEKPLATKVEEGEAMLAACDKAGVLLMYAEDWCFCPALKKVVELVDEGGIGQVLYVKAKECHNGTHSPYAKNKDTCGGGSFIHLGVHPIGWLLYFLGRGRNPVVEVTGKMTGGFEANFIHHENGGEDFGMGMMRFSDGQFAFIEGNYITYGGMDDTVEIYGTEGVIKVNLTFGSPITCYSRPGISYSIEKTDHNIGWTKPAVDEFYNLGYVSELAYFIDCIRGKESLFYGVDGPAGLAGLKLVKSFYQSNEEGRTIRGRWM